MPTRVVAYDLEAELLRAAEALCTNRKIDAFTIDEVRELVTSMPQSYPRLAHPLLAHLIVPLAERLVTDSLFSRSADRYLFTEAARTHLHRAPQCLQATTTNAAITSFRCGQIVDASGRVFQIGDLEDLLVTKPES